MPFSGFSRDTAYTPVPNQLFGSLLEEVQDPAELKVILRGIWLFHRQRGWPPITPLGEFLNDRALRSGLSESQDPAAAIRRGLRLAVKRGVFLHYRTGGEEAPEDFYLLNTEHGRRALAKLRGEAPPASDSGPTPDLTEQSGTKRNIYILYEENIGMLSPMLAEELKDAEEAYPEEWLRQAFTIAVNENKRSWRYISGILRRWAAEGRDHGKPGRHPQEDSRQGYLQEYQRRHGRLPWERAGGRGRSRP